MEKYKGKIVHYVQHPNDKTVQNLKEAVPAYKSLSADDFEQKDISGKSNKSYLITNEKY